MKKIPSKLTLLTLVVILAISACAPAATTPTEAAIVTEPATEGPVALTEQVEAPFTTQADPDLVEAFTTLYKAYYNDEAPVFVETDADLLVTAPSASDHTHGEVPAAFMTDAVLIPLSGSLDAVDFIEFAISIDGQQALIDAGLIPAAITITDQAGNTVEIAQPVQRAISAYGPATAMIYAVGGGDSLVAAAFIGAKDSAGAASMEAIDPRFQDLVGDSYFSQSEFNVEEAANLDPDLVVASARTEWLDSASELGIPTVLYDAETPERLTEAILMTGQVFGPHATAQAQAWVEYYDWLTGQILAQTETIADEDRPKVLFTGTNPLRVASGDMYQTSLIEIAGGVSVSAELTGYWNDVNLEQVAAWDPDIIIVPPYGGATVEAITENRRLADPDRRAGRPRLPDAQIGDPLGHSLSRFRPGHHLDGPNPLPRFGNPRLRRTGQFLL